MKNPQFYIARPVILEALRYESFEVLVKWLEERGRYDYDDDFIQGKINGVHFDIGDYIIRDVDGSVQVISPEVFALRYKPVQQV